MALKASTRADVRVPVHAVVVCDDDGARRAVVTCEQFSQWIDFANRAFGDAGIVFTFDCQRGIDEFPSTLLNDTQGARSSRWQAAKALGNEIAGRYAGHLTVVVRHGPGPNPTGVAFAGVDHDFVVMGAFGAMNHCGHPHVDALAHEIGHYLGLPHTFVGEPFETVDDAARHLVEHGGDPNVFDGDGFTDTPPDPSVRAFECERRPSVTLNGQLFELPRRNLMSYYDERDSLSPQQIARARWVLERRQAHAMQLPRNAPGPHAHEAEALRILDAHGCAAQTQAMEEFGVSSWSGDAQLFCAADNDATLSLELQVPTAGTYRIVVYATLAPDFGILRCTLDDHPCGTPIDLYAPLVLPSGPCMLDRLRLAQGEHRLTVRVVGKHSASTAFCFGIDAIELTQ